MRINPVWFDAIFILRPTLFFPAWTAFLAGCLRFGGIGWGEIILYMIWMGGASGASFLANQWTDRSEDELNDKLLPLWGSRINSRMIQFELLFLAIGVIVGAIWAGGEASALLLLFFLVAGVLYNFAPFRLKGRPILGIFACAGGVWILFILGARQAGADFGAAVLLGMPYAFAAAAASLLTHVPDLRGDRISGVRTFPVVYGIKATAVGAVLFVASSAGLALYLRDLVLISATLLSLPFYMRFFFSLRSEHAEFAVKMSLFSLALMVGLKWIPFLLLIAGYYFFARWYHRARLGIEYPSFGSRSLPVRRVHPLREPAEELDAI
ncbi:MAG: UbiA family prenyltransferase [bacterium]